MIFIKCPSCETPLNVEEMRKICLKSQFLDPEAKEKDYCPKCGASIGEMIFLDKI